MLKKPYLHCVMQCHMAYYVSRDVRQSIHSLSVHTEATTFGMQGPILPAAGGTGWVQA